MKLALLNDIHTTVKVEHFMESARRDMLRNETHSIKANPHNQTVGLRWSNVRVVYAWIEDTIKEEILNQ